MVDSKITSQTNINLTLRWKDGECYEADGIRNTQRFHCKGRGSNMAGPDLAGNNKISASPLEPNLKELEAVRQLNQRPPKPSGAKVRDHDGKGA